MERKVVTLENKNMDYVPASLQRVLGRVKGYDKTRPEFRAMARFVSVYDLTRGAVQRLGVLRDGDPYAREVFVEIYAAYVGAAEGLSLLSADDKVRDAPTSPVIDFSRQTYDSAIRRDLVLNDVLKSYTTVIDCLPGDRRSSYSRNFFRGIINQCLHEKEKLKGKDLLERRLNGVELHVNGSVFYGFQPLTDRQRVALGSSSAVVQATTSCPIDTSLRLEDIIGNDELKEKLMAGMHRILSYDPQRKKNVFAHFPQKFLIHGYPGTGKTETIKAVVATGYRLAEQQGIELKVQHVLGSSFKSEYYSLSAKNLRGIIEDMQSGKSAYVLIMEDIDTIFSSRQETKSEEGKSVFGELINLLEGVGTKNFGNYLLVSTTNRPRDLDAALVRRLAEQEVCVHGPQTKEDFVRLFKIKLGSYLPYVTMNGSEWDQLGEVLVEGAGKFRSLDKERIFAGGDIKNITQRIIALIDDVAFDPSWYKLGFDERLLELQKRRHRITFTGDTTHPGMQGLVGEYVRSELLKRKKEEDTRVEELVADARVREKVMHRLGGSV
ncbi:MAG: ATP-binding protein [Nanoarchaeota archaeon]|nr:ATP-binding protein [Nanoarchaeota archaeon]